ncbi:MAG: RNAse, partial [Polaromonas sp.]|nr:RNAse [Polaromonas sp.]
VQFGTISKFGLMEMSRQRLRPALSEGASIPCPRCGGSGHIRDTESSALQILRIIQEESLKDSTASVLCQVPVDVASFLLNEKRSEISKIEMKQRINVLLVPNKTLETPNYKLERLKHDDPRLDNIEASYKMAEEHEDPTTVTRRSQEKHNRQEPIIKGVLPDAPAPMAPPKPVAVAPAAPKAPPAPPVAVPAPVPAQAETGLFNWIKNLFGMADTPAPAPAAPVLREVKKEEPRGDALREARPSEGRATEGRGERQDRGGRDSRRASGGRRSEGMPSEARPDGRNGERRERNAEGRAEGGRPERERQERPERQERVAGEFRADNSRGEGRADNAGEAQPRHEGASREGRADRSRPRADRPERGERPERAERPERGERSIPRDAAEQDLALANQAAMAGAGAEAASRQERPLQETGRDGERRQPAGRGEGRQEARPEGRGEELNGEGRRERGERPERGGERGNGRRNERRDGNAAPVVAAQAEAPDAAQLAALPVLTEMVAAAPVDMPARTEGQEESQERPPRERRSRDRYGRDRRERGERSEQVGEGNEATAKAPVFEPNPPQVYETPAQFAIESIADTGVVAAESTPVPVAASPAPVAAAAPAPAPAPAPAAKPVTVPAVAAAPAAATGASLPKVQAYELPLQDLAQVAESSGLQWVNSDAAKIAEAQAAIAAEAKPILVPRERPPAVVLDEAPLVLVETRRDLAGMSLPFEKSGG